MRCKFCRKKIEEEDLYRVSAIVNVHKNCQDDYYKKVLNDIRNKKKRAKNEFKKAKKESRLEKTRDTAWKYFSWWARLNKADSYGMVKCYSCNKRLHWKAVDAGHYIAKSKAEYFYFNEDNVRPQCRHCNSFNHDKAIWKVFRDNLIEDIGLERVVELEILKFNPPLVKKDLASAEKLKKKYLNKYKKLKKEKNV